MPDKSSVREGLINSDYIASRDVKQPFSVVITGEQDVEIPDKKTGKMKTKTCLYLSVNGRQLEKCLPLNGENMDFLFDTEGFGENSDNWIGKTVELYTIPTTLGLGVRIRLPQSQSESAPETTNSATGGANIPVLPQAPQDQHQDSASGAAPEPTREPGEEPPESAMPF